jgi:hypothetical protein
MGEKEGNENAKQQRNCAEEEDLRFTAKNRMSAHNLKHPGHPGARSLRAVGIPGRENGCFAKPPAKTSPHRNLSLYRIPQTENIHGIP